jgi:hypothetical protein
VISWLLNELALFAMWVVIWCVFFCFFTVDVKRRRRR